MRNSRQKPKTVLIDLHWLPVKAMYKICVLIFVVMNNGKPEYLRKLLQPFELETGMVVRHARDKHRLFEPRCNTDLGFSAFKNCAQRLYNRLPSEIKSSESVHIFKKRLKTFLFNDCYDLEEKCITRNYSL